MTQTGSAKVEWNPEKKHWQVVIQVGAEVIRRQCAKTPPDAGDPELANPRDPDRPRRGLHAGRGARLHCALTGLPQADGRQSMLSVDGMA